MSNSLMPVILGVLYFVLVWVVIFVLGVLLL